MSRNFISPLFPRQFQRSRQQKVGESSCFKKYSKTCREGKDQPTKLRGTSQISLRRISLLVHSF